MAGLEKILEEIKKENDEIVMQIKQEAQDIAKSMIEEKQKELEDRSQYMDKKMEKVTKLDIDKGISSALSYKRKLILEEKQRLIKDVLEQAKEYIKNLPKDEYIEFFEKVALSHAHKENGKIRLNKQDNEKFASEFVDRINKRLSENGKGTVVLEDEYAKEKTGFIIVYDEIEENCSLEAIFSAKSEELIDKMNEFLFS